MWFKQASFFILDKGNIPDTASISAALSGMPFTHCAGLDWFSEGFTDAVSFEQAPVFKAGDTASITLKREDKVLPAAVVRDLLDEKIAKIADEEGRNVGRREKQELKEQIIDDLLPRAFTKTSRTEAVIDYKRGLLIVGSASAKVAENLLVKVREALGGLNAKLPATKQSPSSLMTSWMLQGECAGRFEFDSSCDMRGAGDVAPVVKVAKQDLTAEEVVRHLKAGKTVTRLGLVWNERIAFVLNDDFTLRSIQYLDTIQEAAQDEGEDSASLAAASQILMVEALGEMMEELSGLLGGWND